MKIIIERKDANMQLPVSFYIPQVSGDWSVTDRQEKTVPSLATLWTYACPSSFWDYLYGSPDNLTLLFPGSSSSRCTAKDFHLLRLKGKQNTQVGKDAGEPEGHQRSIELMVTV